MSFFIKNNVRFQLESTWNWSDSEQTISTWNPIRTTQNRLDSEWNLGVCSESDRFRVAPIGSNRKTRGTEKYWSTVCWSGV